MLRYNAIEIFTGEEVRYRKEPLTDAVLAYVHDLKIAARCVTRDTLVGDAARILLASIFTGLPVVDGDQ